MNYKNMHYAVSMIMLLPSMMHGMLCPLAVSKYSKFSTKLLTRKTFSTAGTIGFLRKIIATPEFSLEDTNKIIKEKLPEKTKDGKFHWKLPNFEGSDDIKCKPNILIEQIVFKATEHKDHEKKYAAVLKQLREHGWSKGGCCITSMLHSAVISDLPAVTEELLCHDKELVHATDMDGCIPLHYARSLSIAQMLLDNGAKIDARDKDGNTPLHLVPVWIVPILVKAGANIQAESDKYLRIPGDDCCGWHKITPLRKAVDEGDVFKVSMLLDAMGRKCDQEVLRSLASLRFWRTNNPAFMEIKNLLE